MIKYAANAMLATRISFMNEVALMCDHLGVDVEKVRRGIGSDPRIGSSFIYPGCGYGGSCFPKDVRAMSEMAKNAGLRDTIFDAVARRNESQPWVLVERIVAQFGDDLSGRTFALWGLAFKPETDDIRSVRWHSSSSMTYNLWLCGSAALRLCGYSVDGGNSDYYANSGVWFKRAGCPVAGGYPARWF